MLKMKIQKLITGLLIFTVIFSQVAAPLTARAEEKLEPPTPVDSDEKGPGPSDLISKMADTPTIQQSGSNQNQSGPAQSVSLFQTDLFSGKASTSVPIAIPAGRAGMQPSIALGYTSSNENGIAGVGWSFGLGLVQRDERKGLTDPEYYGSKDNFIVNFAGASGKLVRVSDYIADGGGYYAFKLESDPSSMDIYYHPDQYWRFHDKSGNDYYFGQNYNAANPNKISRQVHPDNVSFIYAWYLEKVVDVNGNYYEAEYSKTPDHQIKLIDIKYTGNTIKGDQPTYMMQFAYEGRPDKSINYKLGYKQIISERLSNILVQYGAQNISKYQLTYAQSPQTNRSLLKRVNIYSNNGTSWEELTNPVEFDYKNGSKSWTQSTNPLNQDYFSIIDYRYSPIDQGIRFADINGDGLTDIVKALGRDGGAGYPDPGWEPSRQNYYAVWLKTKDGSYQYDTTFRNSFYSVCVEANAVFSKNTGFYNSDWGLRLIDVNADNRADLVLARVGWFAPGQTEVWSTGVWLNNGQGWVRDSNWIVPNVFTSWTNSWAPNSQGYFTDQGLRMGDINSDGYVDMIVGREGTGWGGNRVDERKVYINKPNGSSRKWEQDNGWTNAYNSIPDMEFVHWWTGTRSWDKGTQLVDINGDGLADLIRGYDNRDGTASSRQAWLNTGSGWARTTNYDLPAPFIGWDGTYGSLDQGLRMSDINGDGLLDLIKSYDKIAFNGTVDKLVWLNNGSGWTPDTAWASAIPHDVIKWTGSSSYAYGVELLDINSDGSTDFIKGLNGTTTVWQNQSTNADLLAKITNSLGGKSEIDYISTSTFDNNDVNGVPKMPFITQVVKSIINSTSYSTESGTNSYSYKTEYSYEKGYYDTPKREFWGFGIVTVKDAQNRSSKTFFKQSEGDGLYKGKIAKTELYTSSGQLYNTITNNWLSAGIFNNKVYNKLLESSITDYRDINSEGGGGTKQTKVAYEYDGYANPAKVISYGDTSISGDEKVVVNDYHLTTAKILNLVKTTKVYGKLNYNPTTDIIKKSEYYYDYSDGLDATPQKGLLTKQIVANNVGENPVTKIEYDDWGNANKTLDAKNIPVEIEYDTILHQYPVKVKQKVNDNLTLETTTTYDLARGLALSSTDANGLISHIEYDSLGRVIKQFKPTDTTNPSVKMEYILNSGIPRTVQSILNTDGNYIDSKTYYDGLGRTIASISPGIEKKTDDAQFSGLVADWRYQVISSGIFAVDDSGYSNNAAIYGAEQTTGVKGTAMAFDPAKNAYLEVADDNSLDLTSGLTLETWIKLNPPTENTHYMVFAKQPSDNAQPNYPGNFEFRIGASTGKTNSENIEFLHQTCDASTTECFSRYASNGTLSYNEWHHLTLTADGNKIKFYIDGQLDTELNQSGQLLSNSKSLLIGKRRDGYGYLKGLLDDTKIYNRALSSKEVQQSYSGEGTQSQYIVSGRVGYDSLGRADIQYPSYSVDNYSDNTITAIPSASSNAKTVIEYDHMDRVKKTFFAPGTADEVQSYNVYRIRTGLAPQDTYWETVTLVKKPADTTWTHKMWNFYNAYQQLVKVQELAAGGSPISTTLYSYDAADNLISVTDDKLNKTELFYDALGRKTRMIDPDMGEWKYYYDINGNLTSQIDAKSQTVEMQYDNLNRLTKKIAQEKTTNYYYDKDESGNSCRTQNNLTSTSYGLLCATSDGVTTTKFWFDEFGREVKNTKKLDGQTYQIDKQYDSLDRLVKVTQPQNPNTQARDEIEYTYYDIGAIKSIKGKENGQNKTYVSNIEYNDKGQKTKITYGNGTATTYSYNPNNQLLNNLITADSSGVKKIQDLAYNFDMVGNVQSITDNLNNSNNQSFEYDNLSRLTKAVQTGGYDTINYQYDTIGNLTAKGSTQYTYGNGTAGPHALTGKIEGGQTSNYSYDTNGNMTNRNGDTLTYDSENHMTSAQYTDNSPKITVELKKGWNFISLPFDSTNKDISAILSSLKIGEDYNQISRWNPDTQQYEHYANLGGDQFTDLEYGRGYAINILKDSVTLTLEDNIKIQTTSKSLKKGWNVIGSVITDNQTKEQFLAEIANNSRAQIFRYNAQTYAWEFLGRDFNTIEPGKGYAVYLPQDSARNINVTQTNTKKTTQFVYDENGGRIKKTSSGTTNVYLGPSFELEQTGSSTKVTQSIFEGDNRIVSNNDGTDYWYHQNHLGSTDVLTDSTGIDTKTKVDYYPYGKTFKQTGDVNLTKYLYTGKELDNSTELYYYGARYYDPDLGRFTQADTIVPSPSDPQSFNRYTYAANNPIVYNDPSGHFPLLLAILFGGVSGYMSAQQSGGNVWSGAAFGMAMGAVFGSISSGIGAWAEGVEKAAIGLGGAGFSSLEWTGIGAAEFGISGFGSGIATGFAGGKGSFQDMLNSGASGFLSSAIFGAATEYSYVQGWQTFLHGADKWKSTADGYKIRIDKAIQSGNFKEAQKLIEYAGNHPLICTQFVLNHYFYDIAQKSISDFNVSYSGYLEYANKFKILTNFGGEIAQDFKNTINSWADSLDSRCSNIKSLIKYMNKQELIDARYIADYYRLNFGYEIYYKGSPGFVRGPLWLPPDMMMQQEMRRGLY